MRTPLLLLMALCIASAFLGCDNGSDDDGEGGPAGDDDVPGRDDDDAGDDDAVEPDPYADMAPSGKPIGEIVAIASHMSTGAAPDRDRVFEIERLAETGVGLARRGFYWNQIEPADDAWTFDGYDRMVGLLVDAGLSPLAMLTRGVGWAMPNGSPSDIDPALFADFTGNVAARYADDIDLYEIWNEQNTGRFWSPEQDPDHYGMLLEAAYGAIHEADPSARVLFGGLSPLDENVLDSRGIWNFIARVGRAHPDLCEFIDGVAIHPYTFLQQPGPEAIVDLGIYTYPNLVGSIGQARGLMEELGCGDLPIHLTEVGWPSLLIGLERQAAFLARGALLAASAGAASYCWYTFYDETPDSSIPTEDYFGLYFLPDGETDPDPKPAWHAMRGLVEVLGDSQYAGDLGVVLDWPLNVYALVFVDEAGTWTLALWKAGNDGGEDYLADVPLHPDTDGEWALFGQDGAAILDGEASAGPVTLPITGNVLYLRMPTHHP